MKNLLPLSWLAVCLALAGPAQGQNYALDWFTIDGGGGASSGGAYSLAGTIGQPDAGISSGGGYSLVGGFWGVVASIQSAAPLLSITNASGTVVVSWPLSAGGFALEQTGVLVAPPALIPWNTVPAATYQTNASRIFITVPMPGGNQFYRLRKP